MEGDEYSERLVILQEQVKTKLSVFLQAEFDLDTHKKDSRENEFIEKLASEKKNGSKQRMIWPDLKKMAMAQH